MGQNCQQEIVGSCAPQSWDLPTPSSASSRPFFLVHPLSVDKVSQRTPYRVFPPLSFSPLTSSNLSLATQMETPLRQRKTATLSDKFGEERTSPPSSPDDKDDTSAVRHLESTHPPFVVPNFTIKDLLSSIPAHCFERSALRSSLYVVVDFSLMFAVVYIASFIDHAFGSKGSVVQGSMGVAAKWTAWSVYWVWQSWVMTGIWVLGQSSLST